MIYVLNIILSVCLWIMWTSMLITFDPGTPQRLICLVGMTAALAWMWSALIKWWER